MLNTRLVNFDPQLMVQTSNMWYMSSKEGDRNWGPSSGNSRRQWHLLAKFDMLCYIWIISWCVLLLLLPPPPPIYHIYSRVQIQYTCQLRFSAKASELKQNLWNLTLIDFFLTDLYIYIFLIDFILWTKNAYMLYKYREKTKHMIMKP